MKTQKGRLAKRNRQRLLKRRAVNNLKKSIHENNN